MHDSLKLGRIGGIAVGANWSLLALAASVAYILAVRQLPSTVAGYGSNAYWVAGVATAVSLLVAVLAHELAHAIVARRAKLQVDGITLWFMGGVTRIEGDAPKPLTELAIAIVGPLVSGALGGVALLASSWAHGAGWSLASSALYWLGAINLFLAAFNLLPASPLDGGRVFHGLIWLATRNRWWATKASAGAGVLLGCMCLAGGWYVFEAGDALDGAVLMVMGWFIVSSSKKESLLGRAQHVLGEVDVSDIMRPVYIAPSWLTVDAFWSDWVTPYPEAAFLLERWGGDGWSGVVTAEQLASVPPNMRRSVRARDVALPLPGPVGDSAPPALKPDDPALSIAGRQGVALLVEDQGRPVGVVVAPDIAAIVGRGTPAQRRTWASVWHSPPVARASHQLS